MTPILRFPIQATKSLSVKRVDNGWLVWLAGSPETPHHTYIHLHDDGSMQRVTEGPGEINIIDVKG